MIRTKYETSTHFFTNCDHRTRTFSWRIKLSIATILSYKGHTALSVQDNFRHKQCFDMALDQVRCGWNIDAVKQYMNLRGVRKASINDVAPFSFFSNMQGKKRTSFLPLHQKGCIISVRLSLKSLTVRLVSSPLML